MTPASLRRGKSPGVIAVGTSAKRPSLTNNAYQALKGLILDNELQPNQQLLIHELSEMLGMSRTPIQQALVRLESEGLIEVRPRHGMRVLPLSAEDVGEIYEILAGLEPLALELIVKRRMPDALACLDAAATRMETALRDDSLRDWIEADEQFHAGLSEFCGNERLKGLMEMYWEQAHRVRMILISVEPRPTASTADHRAVVEAIRRNDGAAARKLHRSHRVRVRDLVVETLSTWSIPFPSR